MTIAIVQSDPLVPPGLVIEALTNAGADYRLVRVYEDESFSFPAAISGAVILGGTMCALDVAGYPFLKKISAFIAQGLATDLPMLGICLGGQIMAQAAGGRVRANQNGERGLCSIQRTKFSSALLKGFPSSFLSFQWHDDAFDPPAGAPILAHTDTCPHQAFQAAPKAYGLQFHPEVTPEIADGWRRISGGRSHHVDTLVQCWPAYRLASLALLDNFFRTVCTDS